MDPKQVLELLAKGGVPAIILAVGLSLSWLVVAVRGGKASDVEKANLTTQLQALQAEMQTLRKEMDELKADLEMAQRLRMAYCRQRDQARARVEYLEMLHSTDPRTVWPPDPDDPLPPTPALKPA